MIAKKRGSVNAAGQWGVYSCRGGAGREPLHAECLSSAICAIRDTVGFVAGRHLGCDFEIGSRHRQELIFIPARHVKGLAIGTDSNHVRTVPHRRGFRDAARGGVDDRQLIQFTLHDICHLAFRTDGQPMRLSGDVNGGHLFARGQV